MKKILFIIQIVFMNNLVFAQGLNDVCSPSQLYVYAAGSSGQVLKSTNSGTIYSRIVIGSENLNSIYSVGRRVWCCGDNGFVSISTDFALNWVNGVISSQKLNSVFFIDTLTGFIAGDNGSISKSTNGGLNWSPLTSGVSFNLNKIKFTDQLTGYCSGISKLMLKTTDGGTSWFTIPVSPEVNLKTFDVLGSVIVAGGYSDVIYKSTDNGSSWTERKLNIISHPSVNAVNIISVQDFNILLESGSIWNTTNSGVSFTYSLNDFRDELNAMCIFNIRSYAVSKNQNIVTRSLNSGVTWQLPLNTTYTVSFDLLLPCTLFIRNKLLDINYQRRGGLFVLQKEKLFRSMNFGINWQQISTLPIDSANNYSTQLLVNIADSSKMLAGINLSTPPNTYTTKIYRTSNYGANWFNVYTVNTDPVGNFMNQDPQHPDTVYLGAGDSVFRSTDYGSSWLKIATGNFNDWCDIAVKYDNSQTLYASTNHYPSKINKSTNGGLNWFNIDFIADTNYTEMPAIALSNLSTNIVLHAQLGNTASAVGLKRSYTGGNTWLFNQFPGTSWSVDIAKDDPNLYAYGSVSYDPVFLTTNSGGNFIGTPNFYAEQLLYYDRANLFINNHGEISKLKVVYNMPVISIENISSEIPNQYSLSQNYPNPFNPETNINFAIVKSSNVKLIIYDITGKEVLTLADERLQPGIYNVKWDASGYPSGVYFYRIVTGDFAESRKMILVK